MPSHLETLDEDLSFKKEKVVAPVAAASTMAETTASEAETTAGSELKASVANAAADKARLSVGSVSSAGDGSDSKPEVVKAGQSSGTASLSLHPLSVCTPCCTHSAHPLCTPTHSTVTPTLHPLCTHSAPIPHPLSYADSLLDASQHSVMSLDDSEDGGSSARADASWHGGNSMFGAPFLK